MSQPYDPANPGQQPPGFPSAPPPPPPGSFGPPPPGPPQGQGGYPPAPGGQGGYPPAPGGPPPPPYGGPPPAPPYGGPSGPPPSDHPVQLTIPYPERSSRGLAALGIVYLLKFIALLPSIICLYAIGIAAFIVWWIAEWVILFTGRYPQGMHRFVTGYLRWSSRTLAWLFSLTDTYPPFRLSP
jgi:hypothetical protein